MYVCCGKFCCQVKQVKDLIDISSTRGGGRTQSAASECAAASDLSPPLFPLRSWRHWGDKVIDDWEAVRWDAMRSLHRGQTSARLLVHLGVKLMKLQLWQGFSVLHCCCSRLKTMSVHVWAVICRVDKGLFVHSELLGDYSKLLTCDKKMLIFILFTA